MSSEVPKNKKDETPFREELINRRRSHRMFKTTPSLKGKKIIREEFLHKESGVWKDFIAARKELGLLRNKYGIAVPNFQLVEGKGPESRGDPPPLKGASYMFTIVDEIKGKSLDKVDNLPPESAPKFNHFFEQLIQYFVDARREGRTYLDDIFVPRQYKYGRKPGETEDRIYLVDIDPYLRRANMWNYHMIKGLKETLAYILDFEEMFFKKGDLDGARNKANEAIKYLEREQEGEKKKKA